MQEHLLSKNLENYKLSYHYKDKSYLFYNKKEYTVCHQFSVALISASAIGFQGQMFMVEGESACYECLFPKEDNANESLRCADSGVLATTPNVMASLQAHHALLYLGLGLTPLKEKILLWDGLSMKQRIVNFQIDTNCSTCQAI